MYLHLRACEWECARPATGACRTFVRYPWRSLLSRISCWGMWRGANSSTCACSWATRRRLNKPRPGFVFAQGGSAFPLAGAGSRFYDQIANLSLGIRRDCNFGRHAVQDTGLVVEWICLEGSMRHSKAAASRNAMGSRTTSNSDPPSSTSAARVRWGRMAAYLYVVVVGHGHGVRTRRRCHRMLLRVCSSLRRHERVCSGLLRGYYNCFVFSGVAPQGIDRQSCVFTARLPVSRRGLSGIYERR